MSRISFFRPGIPVFALSQRMVGLIPKIDVGRDIAESCDLPPVSIRVSLLEIRGKVLDRLTNHLKIPDNGIPASPVSDKTIVRYAGSILFDIPDRVKDVIEQLQGRFTHTRPRRGCAV